MTGIYVGTSEIKNIYVGTTPVKEVYVGTTKVRPTEVVGTYTISSPWQNDTLSQNIYKSGYKIKSIVITGTIRFSGSAQLYVRMNTQQSTRGGSQISNTFDCGLSNRRWQIQTGYDGGSWTTYTSGGAIYANTNYPIEITYTRSGGTMKFNGTTTALSSNLNSYITAIFNSSTPYIGVASYNNSYPLSSNPITFTVTYEPA